MDLQKRCEDYYKILTPNQAAAFSLRFGVNSLGTHYTLYEIADTLGVSHTVVDMHIKKALSYLKNPYFRPIVEGLKNNDSTL